MLDYRENDLFLLSELGGRIPPRKGGKPISMATLYRWSGVGLRGVVLETTKIGGCAYTSLAAFDRFLAAVDATRTRNSHTQPTPTRVVTQRELERREETRRQLDARGLYSKKRDGRNG